MAGCGPWTCAAGDAFAGVAGGAAVYRADRVGGSCREYRAYKGDGSADPGCCERGGEAFDAFGQWRTFDAAEVSELLVGSTGGGFPCREFHRGWDPSGRCVSEDGSAGERDRAQRAGDGRGDAGDVCSGVLQARRGGCRVERCGPCAVARGDAPGGVEFEDGSGDRECDANRGIEFDGGGDDGDGESGAGGADRVEAARVDSGGSRRCGEVSRGGWGDPRHRDLDERAARVQRGVIAADERRFTPTTSRFNYEVRRHGETECHAIRAGAARTDVEDR